jgi:hypothetical protein
MDTKYWNLWKVLVATLTVRSRGFSSDGKKPPNESSLTMCEKLKAVCARASQK